MTTKFNDAYQMKQWINFKRSTFCAYLMQSCTIILYICPYIITSISMTFFQNSFMKSFHFPFIVVSFHLLFKFLMAALLRCLYQHYTGQSRPTLSPDVYVKKMSAVGIFSALDIGLSNWSYQFITVLLYTMTKSSCVIFILFFSILFGLERARPSLAAVVVFIASGLFMLTYHSTSFNMVGFLLVLAASFLGGIRWTMAQLVMQRNENGLSNPIDMMYYIQPWMLVGIVPLACWFEVIPAYEQGLLGLFDAVAMYHILIGCLVAFMIELSEYFLIVRTSSLTLVLSSIIKEIITVILAVTVKNESMSLINVFGLCICMLGIFLHVWLKISEITSNDKNNDKQHLIRYNQREK